MTRILNSVNSNSKNTIKFLYSYGGRIVPRLTDGKLIYSGGMTRVLSVERSVSYTELAVKFVELYGSSMKLRCKLPTEDFDVLVSVTCDDDLANVIQAYEQQANQDMKIRAILCPIKSVKESPPPSPVNFSANTPPKFPAPKTTQRPFFNFSSSKPTQYSIPGVDYSVGQRIRPSQVQYSRQWSNYRQ